MGNGMLTFSGLERKRLLQSRCDALSRRYPVMGELADVLLAHGGDVLVARPDDEAEAILARGFLVPAGDCRLEPGAPSRCHHNAVGLWRRAPRRYVLFTGYGLSVDSDGLACWRQHSWLWDTLDSALVETTEPRTRYYGYALAWEATEVFAERL